MEDFASNDGSFLDTWVFDQVQVTDWLNEWSIYLLTNCWLTDWLIYMIYFLFMNIYNIIYLYWFVSDILSECLIYWFIGWLSDWLLFDLIFRFLPDCKNKANFLSSNIWIRSVPLQKRLRWYVA